MARAELPIVGCMNIPFAIPGCYIESTAEEEPDRLVICARRREAGSRCPDCGCLSRSVHSRYRRHPADLPIAASRTSLRIEVRRFYCSTPSCDRRTFAEPWPELVERHARRTRRLGEVQGRVGIACGGEGGARLLKHLRMPASPATMLRLVRAMPMPEAPPPIHVGVDDWAMRRAAATARSWWTWTGTASSTFFQTAARRRWRAGLSGAPHQGRGSTARPSTPVAPASALPGPCKSPTAGTCSPTCVRPSNAGSMALMPGFGVCRPSPDQRRLLRPGEIMLFREARRSGKRARRAGRNGGPSTTR